VQRLYNRAQWETRTPDPLIKSQVQSRPEPNIDQIKLFRDPLAFSSMTEGLRSASAKKHTLSIGIELIQHVSDAAIEAC
jgi:hypothetical protein